MYEAASSPHSSGLPAKPSLELGEAAPPKDSNVYVDFFGAGAVMGEMGILQQTSRCASVECETDVQVHTVEPPNKGHLGTSPLFRGVLYSEVRNVLAL